MNKIIEFDYYRPIWVISKIICIECHKKYISIHPEETLKINNNTIECPDCNKKTKSLSLSNKTNMNVNM